MERKTYRSGLAPPSLISSWEFALQGTSLQPHVVAFPILRPIHSLHDSSFPLSTPRLHDMRPGKAIENPLAEIATFDRGRRISHLCLTLRA